MLNHAAELECIILKPSPLFVVINPHALVWYSSWNTDEHKLDVVFFTPFLLHSAYSLQVTADLVQETWKIPGRGKSGARVG